ncbi:hypothetical protein HY639_04330 [Candidatus Woesearchaeota archaeon]|nr:hypothetical protein [Candidatus Woesearchaeota archaeon]
MANVCPTCGNHYSKKLTECPSCAEASSPPSKRAWRWYDGLVIIAALAVIYLILTTIKVPYVVEEQYTVQERYEEEVPYTEREEYNVTIPYNITQLTTDYEEYTPERKTTKEACYYRDMPYVVNYWPGLQNPYNAGTETGYRYNPGSVYGEYHQVAEVCRSATREQTKDSRFRATFAICNYVGEKKVDCPDRLYTFGGLETGYSKKGTLEDPKYPGTHSSTVDLICFRQTLIWKTPYDEKKSIRLEALQLPQIQTCEQQDIIEKINPYTEHGQRAQTSYRPVEREVIKTLSKVEARTREVTKTKMVEKLRDVTKTRYLTKERTLWEELQLDYFS